MEKGGVTSVESNLIKIEKSEIVVINIKIYSGEC